MNHTDFALNLSGTGASQTSPSNSHAVNFSYGYDNAGQLTHVQNDAALAQNIKYTYDIAGNLLGYTDTTQIQPYFSNSGHPSHSTDITTTRTTYAHLGAYAQAGVYTTRSHYGDVNLAQITASGQGPDVTDSAVSTTWYDANGFVSNTTQVQNGNVNNPSTPFNRAFVNDAQGHAVYVNQGAGSGGNSSNPNIDTAVNQKRS